MSLSRIYAIFLRQFYLIRSSTTRLVPLFIWVAIDIVIWGFITRYLNSVNGAGFNFVPTMLGAVLLWGFLVRVMQGVNMAFLEDIWSRNFLNIFASPISIREYLSGLIASSIATSAVGLAVMLILATCVFGFSFLSLGLALYPFLLTLFIFGIALGIFGAAIVLKNGPSAEWFIWPIPAVISPFVGVLYPISVLPAWMQAVSHALPASYIFESMRALLLGKPWEPSQLILALTLAFVYLLASGWYFARIYRHALKTGLIARYSAENVS